jgi:hypothetical protein
MKIQMFPQGLARHVAAALAGGMLLAMAACSTVEGPASEPPSGLQVAADWSEHSRPLFNYGPGLSPGTTNWRVPDILPKGNYRVIRRVGGTAEVIDGYRFEIDGTPFKEIHLMLPSNYNEVEALEEKYIVEPKTARKGS